MDAGTVRTMSSVDKIGYAVSFAAKIAMLHRRISVRSRPRAITEASPRKRYGAALSYTLG